MNKKINSYTDIIDRLKHDIWLFGLFNKTYHIVDIAQKHYSDDSYMVVKFSYCKLHMYYAWLYPLYPLRRFSIHYVSPTKSNICKKCLKLSGFNLKNLPVILVRNKLLLS